MEIFLTLIKYLTASLTPFQFLGVTTITGLVLAFVVRYAISKRKAIKFLISGKSEEDDTIKLINEKLNDSITREEFEASLTRLESTMRHEIHESAAGVSSLKEKFVEISLLRQEIVDREFDRLFEAIDSNKKFFTGHHEHSATQHALILSSTNRILETQARTMAQVEKIDGYIQAAIPEFRGYHRELSSDLKTLSRDLALIERSVELSINTGTAVKLR